MQVARFEDLSFNTAHSSRKAKLRQVNSDGLLFSIHGQTNLYGLRIERIQIPT